VCYQVEWQRNYLKLSRQRLRTQDGQVIEFLAAPAWESSAQLFAEAEEAAAFAIAVLKAEPLPCGLNQQDQEERGPEVAKRLRGSWVS
jgi:hypothetical protein